MGDVVPLFGHAFNAYFPITVAAVCVVTLFNLYTFILASLDIERFQFSSTFRHPQIDVGQSLVTEARRYLPDLSAEHVLSPSSSSSPSSFPSSSSSRIAALRESG